MSGELLPLLEKQVRAKIDRVPSILLLEFRDAVCALAAAKGECYPGRTTDMAAVGEMIRRLKLDMTVHQVLDEFVEEDEAETEQGLQKH